jgi:Nif-specific regulatory protein
VLLTDSTMVAAKELLRFSPNAQGTAPDRPYPETDMAKRVHTPSQALVRDYFAVQSHSATELQQALIANGGNQSRAAQAIGLTARQFGYRLRKLGL